jgi:hypothetical protein
MICNTMRCWELQVKPHEVRAASQVGAVLCLAVRNDVRGHSAEGTLSPGPAPAPHSMNVAAWPALCAVWCVLSVGSTFSTNNFLRNHLGVVGQYAIMILAVCGIILFTLFGMLHSRSNFFYANATAFTYLSESTQEKAQEAGKWLQIALDGGRPVHLHLAHLAYDTGQEEAALGHLRRYLTLCVKNIGNVCRGCRQVRGEDAHMLMCSGKCDARVPRLACACCMMVWSC